MALLVFSTDIIFHRENFGEFMIDGLTLLKKLSNWMWNFGILIISVSSVLDLLMMLALVKVPD